jgi:diacylglycerol kinase (ATP)
LGGAPQDRDTWTLAARVQSFRYAFAGVRALFATEPHAWVHLVATVAVVSLAAMLGLAAADWCWLVLAIGLVWVAEAFNTALESLADATAPDPDPRVGRAKDVAAGAVLLASMAAAIIGFLVLGPPLWRWLAG